MENEIDSIRKEMQACIDSKTRRLNYLTELDKSEELDDNQLRECDDLELYIDVTDRWLNSLGR